MDKDNFNSLTIDEQVKSFNGLLVESSIRKVCQALNIGKTTIRDRFKKHGYIFRHELNQYVKEENVVGDDKEIKINKNLSSIDQQERESNINLPESKKNQEKAYLGDMKKFYSDVQELLELKEDIKALLQREKMQPNIVEIPELKINNFEGELQSKSIKIYSEVLKEFNTFMEEHKGLKQQDVISQALWEFLKKYK